MNKPLISIIIPVYNVEAYLRECLDSIVNQTIIKNFEVIIIDDGSTDKSGKICDEYSNKYPKLLKVIHQNNKGLGGARNTGISHANGKYLMFLDSDDYIKSTALLTLLRYVKRYPKVGIIVYGTNIVSEEGNLLGVMVDNKAKKSIHTLSVNKDLLHIYPNACNKLIRKDLFINNNINFPNQVWYEDIRTIPKLYPYANILVIDELLYNYRQRIGSIMQSGNSDRNLEILDAFNDIFEYYKDANYYNKYLKELEFLAIEHIYIAALVRVIRINPNSKFTQCFIVYMNDMFPHYYKNEYLKKLSLNKKIIYYLLRTKSFKTIYLIFRFKDALHRLR